jgi:hypothetical protein
MIVHHPVFVPYPAFVLPDKNGYKIMKVQAEDILLFQKQYSTDILCEADTLGELLLQFDCHPIGTLPNPLFDLAQTKASSHRRF